jgi:hypothetical protein
MSDQLPAPAVSNTFERIKRVNESGAEFWSSRDFAQVLGYTDYRDFEAVVEKARTACFNSGQRVEDHFVEINEMIEIGKGGQRSVKTVMLSHYPEYAIFMDHGYRGLYGGLGMRDIHERKRLKPKEHILDHMGSLELAANLFRTTQAEHKLRRENVRSKKVANRIHSEVGRKVRKTIHELGGTMPENLPVAESIKKVEGREKKRLKAAQKGAVELPPSPET